MEKLNEQLRHRALDLLRKLEELDMEQSVIKEIRALNTANSRVTSMYKFERLMKAINAECVGSVWHLDLPSGKGHVSLFSEFDDVRAIITHDDRKFNGVITLCEVDDNEAKLMNAIKMIGL